MSKPRFYTVCGMILMAAISRVIPHPWNLTPVAAMALFSGVHFSDKRLAFLVPLAAMALSDIFLGWHGTLPFVYISFALVVVIGQSMRPHLSAMNLVIATIGSASLFFLVTNFGYWLMYPQFPHTFSGLMACYTAAIPFFRNTVGGDLFYVALFFGSFALAQRRFPVLREASVR